jgi:hypothetical protein
MAQCKSYKEKPTISPDIFLSGIPVCCGNCLRWLRNKEKCREEIWVREWENYLLEGAIW